MDSYTFNHRGQSRGASGKLYRWKPGETITVPPGELAHLDPKGYEVASLPASVHEGKPAPQAKVNTNPMRTWRKSGGWIQLLEDGQKVKSTRNEAEAEAWGKEATQ